MDNRRRNRLIQVRQQSKDFAQQVRRDVKLEKEQQLKKVQAVRKRELNEWKHKTQNEIQQQYGQCLSKFGNAHLDACEASCEENESLFNKREEFDLLTAERGRTAMLQEHRKREREVEFRLLQKKRKLLRNAMVQVDLISKRDFGANVDTLHAHKEAAIENEKIADRVEAFVKRNDEKSSSNAAYARHADESSSGPGIVEKESDFESELEFEQITNFLKQHCFARNENDEKAEDIIIDSEKDYCISAQKNEDSSSKAGTTQKSSVMAPDLARYLDLNRKYTTIYELDKNIGVENKNNSKANVRTDAKKHDPVSRTVLRQLGEIPSNAEYEKGTKRGCYERLRIELDEALTQDKSAKQAAEKVLEGISANQLSKLEQTRKKKMNDAVENSLKRNIFQCPIADSKTLNRANSTEMNVRSPEIQTSDTSSKHKATDVTSEKTEFEIDRLKKLLVQINQQKNKILGDFKKSQDISGPDWKKLAKCLEKLLEEKCSLSSKTLQSNEKDEELLARERELDEREKRLENHAKQLKVPAVVPPVEIIIKVHPKLDSAKIRKSIRVIDTLSKEPSKVYRRTPKKIVNVKTTPHETTRSPKKSTNREEKPPVLAVEHGHKSEDSSISTTYQLLPEKISLKPTQKIEENGTVHHKLNKDLMKYITRLLGMNIDIGKQLSLTASTVPTPGSSTINASGNDCSSNTSGLCFDSDFKRLQEFISDNYSFLGEVSNALEKTEDQNDECSKQVEGIWRETLCEKKLHRKAREVKPGKSVLMQLPSLNKQTREKAVSSAGPSCSHITIRDMVDVTRHLESHMLTNFAEYTANCHKRIDDIAQMMDQVRREKQKLIENSLSSGEFGHYTEYIEIQGAGRKQIAAADSANDPKESSSQREDLPSEEINNILQKQTRPFGVSKDSGISMLSRPVTSSDFRDSPDVRVNSDERENTFRPILKDVIKPTHMRLTKDGGSMDTNKNILLSTKDQDEKGPKKSHKTPLSLNRFSPHIEKPRDPHELSTIVEVETPSVSKVNLLINADDHVDIIEPFPSFTAYERNLQPDKEYKSFVTLDYVKNVFDDITLNSFAGLQDYGIIGVSKCDNRLDEAEQSSEKSSSDVDIIKELKRRNILTEPFKYMDSHETNIENFMPFTTSQRDKPHQKQFCRNKPDSEVRMKDLANLNMKCPDSTQERDSTRSNDTLSGIQEIDIETKASSSTKSSTETGTSTNIKSYQKSSPSDRSSSSSKTGQPMNLKDFLSRELNERSLSHADKSSRESSLSSHFMQALLNVSSRRSGSSSISSDRDKLRTSTPVHHNANSTVIPSINTQLITCTSISTLKFSEDGSNDRLGNSNSSD